MQAISSHPENALVSSGQQKLAADTLFRQQAAQGAQPIAAKPR
jgi:hypothetical protein